MGSDNHVNPLILKIMVQTIIGKDIAKLEAILAPASTQPSDAVIAPSATQPSDAATNSAAASLICTGSAP